MIAIGAVALVLSLALPIVGQESPAPPPPAPPPTRIDLVFTEPTSVLTIYRVLARPLGLGLIFDPALADRQLTLDLRDMNVADAFEALRLLTGHLHLLVHGRALLVAPDTPANRRRYEEQVLQTFVLDNVAAKDMATLLRSLLGLRQIAVNERLNTLTIRDTAARVAVAARFLARQDRR